MKLLQLSPTIQDDIGYTIIVSKAFVLMTFLSETTDCSEGHWTNLGQNFMKTSSLRL